MVEAQHGNKEQVLPDVVLAAAHDVGFYATQAVLIGYSVARRLAAWCVGEAQDDPLVKE